MKGVLVLRNPSELKYLDGSGTRIEWWGKFVKYSHPDFGGSGDSCYSPIFDSLWPGLWLSPDKVRKIEPKDYPEFLARTINQRIRVFFHYQKLSLKKLFS